MNKLAGEKYDVLVIGGGITGAGIALDAQARGLKTALVEMQDFAAGTSSRSTKLIHGGLRYLKQFELKLVAEVGSERAVVYKNGRHVTRPEVMLLPLVNNGSIGYWGASFGLWLYDFLAGVSKKERRKMLSKEDTLMLEPLLNKDILRGGASYYEYRTDDARLTIEVMKEAVERGAVACNYVKAVSFLNESGKIKGILAKDMLTGDEFSIQAGTIVNATGPWVDALDAMNDKDTGNKLLLTKGVHIVLDSSVLPIRQATYFDVSDGRMVFAIPRDGKVYVGTTDTAYKGEMEDPQISAADKEYLIHAIGKIFAVKGLQISDIQSGWAGLRPLIRQKGKSPSAVSRKDEIFQYPSGLITIAGGKLTGYRKMAERIVDLIAARSKKETGRQVKPCVTATLKISGGNFESEEAFKSFVRDTIAAGEKLGLTIREAMTIANRYGSNAWKVLDLVSDVKARQKHGDLSFFVAGLVLYSIEAESVHTLSDFFIRRTGALYFDIEWVHHWREKVAQYMGHRLSWPEEKKQYYMKELEQHIQSISYAS